MKRSARALLPEQLRSDECADDGQDDPERLATAQLRLAARAGGHVHRDLLQAEAGVGDADQSLDLRRVGRERLREQRAELSR
jgi:hypothetical protein